MWRDVSVDQVVNAIIHGVGAVEVLRQIVGEMHVAVRDVAQAAMRRHAAAGDCAQVDGAPAVAPDEVMVGLAAHALAARMPIDRRIVLAEIGEPLHRVAARINPRATRRPANDQMHRPASQMQILRDPAAGLARADHQHRATRQLPGIAIDGPVQRYDIGRRPLRPPRDVGAW